MQIDDDVLVGEILAGSQLAFGVLVNRYERLIYQISYRHAQCAESAMDLCQNVFLKIHQRLDSYQGSGTFKGWMLRLAHNECLDWLRRQRHEQHSVDLDELDLPSGAAAPEAAANHADQQRVLQAELGKLSEKHRLAVNLRYFEQYSLNEIAEVLECSEGTVKSILFRALSKLRGRAAFQRREAYV